MKAKVILMVFSVVATFGVLSAQATKTQTSTSISKKSCYVDVNNNNVCDKSENKTCTGQCKGLKNGNEQGKGLRNGSGGGKGNCKGVNVPNYVDANNDGVCDNNKANK